MCEHVCGAESEKNEREEVGKKKKKGLLQSDRSERQTCVIQNKTDPYRDR